MTVSISCARPITGSSLPCLASAVRSRLTLSRLGVSLFPSTAFLGALAHHAHRLLAERLGRQAVPAQQIAGQPFFRGQTDEQVLGAEVAVPHVPRGIEGGQQRRLDPR